MDRVEVYVKSGRSRSFERTGRRQTVVLAEEAGWAIRAGDRQGSFFLAGSGPPSPPGPWPRTEGQPLAIPEAATAPPWSEPSDFSAPLVAEREGFALLDAIERELAAELAGARLLSAILQDGSSESEVASSRGVRARWRSRLAALRLSAAGPATGSSVALTASLHLAVRDVRRFNPRALARRLADHLLLRRDGGAVDRDRGALLLAPAVGIHLLAGLLPFFVGREAEARMTRLRDRSGKVASSLVTLVDDGRLPGGALEAPVDGEGTPTRALTLIESGSFRQPLLSWVEAEGTSHRATGCARRASWRDLPRPGPTHLYLAPRRDVPVASLLSQMARGYYLVDVAGAGRFDPRSGELALPVAGFAVHAGRAKAAVAECWLCGQVEGFLHGIDGVARDLTFQPLDGMIGCPSLLVSGLELRGDPAS